MHTRRTKGIVQIGLIALGVGMIVWGVLRGEATVVFQKAVKICLECIGVG